MRYSLLIVAIDCHFSHITRFVSNLKQENPDAEIHFFTDTDETEIPEGISANVDEIIYQNLSFERNYWGLVKKILSLRKRFRVLAKENKFDVVNIQFPHFYTAFIMRYLRKISKRIVVSPWGSDILRVDGLRYKILSQGVLSKCDYITTPPEGNIGKKILFYLPEIRSKFYPQAWGSETIDYINNHVGEIDTLSAKEHFGIADRYVITCGYNAFTGQNHLKIIEAIKQVRAQLPDNLLLLFPVSYGSSGKDKYIESLKNRCREEQFEALFIEKYLSVPEVFLLRMATDMFIHTQKTDAGCASLQEYVLCDKKIVHGSWIQYPMLEQYPPLCYHTAPDFSSLGGVIVDTYSSEPIEFSKDVCDYIKSNGWETRRKEWNEMFIKLASS